MTLSANTTESNNTAVGYRALTVADGASATSAFGSDALLSCTTGNYNLSLIHI